MFISGELVATEPRPGWRTTAVLINSASTNCCRWELRNNGVGVNGTVEADADAILAETNRAPALIYQHSIMNRSCKWRSAPSGSDQIRSDQIDQPLVNYFQRRFGIRQCLRNLTSLCARPFAKARRATATTRSTTTTFPSGTPQTGVLFGDRLKLSGANCEQRYSLYTPFSGK